MKIYSTKKIGTMIFESRWNDCMFILILMIFISFSKSFEEDVSLKSSNYFTKLSEKGRINHSSAHRKQTKASRPCLLKPVWNKQTERRCSYK